jgi:GNAT superfamily N-acetyltransferase
MSRRTPPPIRPLDPACASEVDLVAERMRLTLVEVLGEERGGALYDREWLRRRVLWHALPEDGRRAQVLVSQGGAGQITGHTIVRVEPSDDGEGGLFSTTYVEPATRRSGVAAALVRAGEDWLREAGMSTATTYTDADNAPLQRLFLACGYEVSLRQGEWIGLSRAL